jgi:hypothetical protein
LHESAIFSATGGRKPSENIKNITEQTDDILKPRVWICNKVLLRVSGGVLEGKVQWLLFVFEKVPFQRIDLIEPIVTGLWNRRICFCS